MACCIFNPRYTYGMPCYIPSCHIHVRCPRVFCSSKSNWNPIKIKPVVDFTKLCPEAVVGDPALLMKKIATIQHAGPAGFQVITDFDATLTKCRIDGVSVPSSHSLLQQENPEYNVKRRELSKYYHAREIDPKIPLDVKKKLMAEWFQRYHNLLIEGGLTRDAIGISVATSIIAFRDGLAELFKVLEDRDVPVLIFSAGLGDVIDKVLCQKLQRSFKNVEIVANWMVFDQNDRLVSIEGNIHSLNKEEHASDMAAQIIDRLGEGDVAIGGKVRVKKRSNVLLLGDQIGDLGMSVGFKHEARISVGFLNENSDRSIDSYRKAFDVVFLNDAPMWGLVELVKLFKWKCD